MCSFSSEFSKININTSSLFVAKSKEAFSVLISFDLSIAFDSMDNCPSLNSFLSTLAPVFPDFPLPSCHSINKVSFLDSFQIFYVLFSNSNLMGILFIPIYSSSILPIWWWLPHLDLHSWLYPFINILMRLITDYTRCDQAYIRPVFHTLF